MAEQDVRDLVGLVADAASAFIRGDMYRYTALIKHTGDYTLLAPFGGEPVHGFDDSAESLTATARWFGGGEADVELVESYVSGDLAVLVVIERQHGLVGGMPDQDWSLRVTLVFRREEAEWRLAHRHADPLMHRVSTNVAAALARGDLGADD
ncbi:nuclear transport factor 2 family protein [Actinoplanes sp. NPDC024001]|uniref:YybH family protein n=1 Tax=Actinoplanes sp. NPDC024001 TaxID=3154598 RepID=UPI0033CBF0D7